MGGNADEILTIRELSDYLKVPISTLYKLAREGLIPCTKVGKHWRFQKNAIDTLSLVFIMILLTVPVVQAQQEKPNVVVIMLDNHGWASSVVMAVVCYGEHRHHASTNLQKTNLQKKECNYSTLMLKPSARQAAVRS